jgi:hypothetical protein
MGVKMKRAELHKLLVDVMSTSGISNKASDVIDFKRLDELEEELAEEILDKLTEVGILTEDEK